MKKLTLLIALAAGLSSPFMAVASGTHNDSHAKMAASNVQSHKATGTFNKNNPDGSVSITHGPVKSLGWPGMTMDFQVKDKALLKGIKAGQKISFDIGKEASGYVITAISAAK